MRKLIFDNRYWRDIDNQLSMYDPYYPSHNSNQVDPRDTGIIQELDRRAKESMQNTDPASWVGNFLNKAGWSVYRVTGEDKCRNLQIIGDRFTNVARKKDPITAFNIFAPLIQKIKGSFDQYFDPRHQSVGEHIVKLVKVIAKKADDRDFETANRCRTAYVQAGKKPDWIYHIKSLDPTRGRWH